MAATDLPLAPALFPDPEDDLRALLVGIHGRVSRALFWRYAVLGCLLVQTLAYFLLVIAGVREPFADSLSTLLVAWPGVAVSVKRWHDRGKSGWWMLINLVPVIGTLWTLVECGLLRGTPGPNRFGPDPLAAPPRAFL